ncbi:hypothetical protein [Paenibacillus thalictri]|uniref:Methyltransferase n=1 Tax=Paenibacillus thalictri TaxID=2527873 RepID=A0A4Q9DTF8_9BACL|nr:hypothetical protein [Paenibacillus thalictri]TBL80216.1 hypothetical protein EYB31_07280 [Paenibacillus thalictri]
MSRKWERMVEKNTKQLNKTRAKQGKKPISETSSESGFVMKGRSWLFPLLLIFVGIFCFISFRGANQDETMYWVTGGSYVALGVFTYFVRRPYLKISKKALTTRRFSGNRTLEAEDVTAITILKDAVVIEGANKQRWMFSRIYHLMNITEVGERLAAFAKTHNITVKDN